MTEKNIEIELNQQLSKESTQRSSVIIQSIPSLSDLSSVIDNRKL
jgi:hypothetical protein